MKIVKLSAENIKKIKAVEITPDGNLVEITGRNGSGKTSVLDSIWYALAGLTNIPGKPIREGESKGSITLTLDGKEQYVITRSFTQKEGGDYTTSLKVVNAEGAVFPSPQGLLDKLFGSLSFDPLAFSRMSAREQAEQLKTLVKDFDFRASEKKEKELYDERTLVNRRAKESSLLHVSFKDVSSNPPPKVDVQELTGRLTKASEDNARIEKERSERVRTAEQLEHFKTVCENEQKMAIARMKEADAAHEKACGEYAKAELLYEMRKKEYESRRGSLEGLPALAAPQDLSSIKAELDTATEKNKAFDTWSRKEQARQDVEKYEKQSTELTNQIEQLKIDRLAAIQKAGLPVAGLGLTEDGVMLNNLPLKQASDAEQLRTSVAVAMAMNPTLKIVRVRDGSLLDENGLKLLAQMAEEKDYQIWVERVDTSGKVGFVMEDGSLKQ